MARTRPSRTLILLTLVLLGATGAFCARIPDAPVRECRKIAVGPGPEDFALDAWTGPARLLVSVHERRAWTEPGEIWAVDLATRAARKLPRENEPAGSSFRPHGVDAVRTLAGETRLYVISHGPEQDDDQHAIFVYRVEPDRLVFIEALTHELLVSPNDLDVLPDGSLFVGNDSGTRGSLVEMALGLRRANVIHYDGRGGWQVAARDIAFTNGILARPDGSLLVAATTGNRIIRFAPQADGTFQEAGNLAELTGPDNLMALGANELTVAAHPSGLAFLSHASDPASSSPSVVYRIDIASGTTEAIYADDGTQISASSTGLVHDGRLYIGQVFEPFVLECKL